MSLPCYIYNSNDKYSWKLTTGNCEGGLSADVQGKVCILNAYDSSTKTNGIYKISSNIASGCSGSSSVSFSSSEITELPTNNYTATDYQFVSMSFIVLAVFFIVGYLTVK